MITTYERGLVDGMRMTAMLQLREMFGLLSTTARQRVEALSRDELCRLLINILRAGSLKELRLED